VHRSLLISLLAAAVLGTAAGRAGPVAAPPTRVTVIGDSIAYAIVLDPSSTRVLGRRVDLDLQLAVCRRLVDEGCPYQGSRPLSLVELLPTLRLGSTVVVAVGYNDHESTFATAVETSLQALRSEGVEHVLWLTLRAERQSYLAMNDVIRAAADRHPELTIVDWNLYSRSHPDWFQDDGLHLNSDGSLAMATLVHRSLDELGLVAAPVARRLTIATRTLAPARVGRPYLVRLTASGGTRPFTWSRTAGVLPAGVRLGRNGTLAGTPRAAGRTSATLRATDARGRSTSRRFVLVVH
jgi:lysophospholipase L1-like esterase